MNGFFCVCVSGSNIPMEISDVIFKAASELFKTKQKTIKIESSHCEGFISTKYLCGSIGDVYGLVFKGKMAWLDKTSTFEFICRERNLENPPEKIIWEDIEYTYSNELMEFSLN